MKKILALPLIAIILTIFCNSAFSQQTFNHTDAKVVISLPENWKTEKSEDQIIASSSAGDISFIFQLMEASDLTEKAIKDIEKSLEKEIGKITIKEENESKLNGMDAYIATGTAKKKGETLEIALTLILTPANKIMMIIALADPATSEKYTKDIEYIFSNIKPME